MGKSGNTWIVVGIAVALMFGVFVQGQAAEMNSATYVIPSTSMSGGGAPMTSFSYEANGTVGQSTPLMDPGDPPVSISYDLFPGFWYTLVPPGLEPCEGDFEPDGDVDVNDLVVFAADFGRADCDVGDPCEGDFEPDNDVDGLDLAIFAEDFARTDCP